MENYNAVWILSSNHPDVETLTEKNLMRLKKGLEIYVQAGENIALSGASSVGMQKYLISNSVPEETIYHELFSRDTVGNVVFFEIAMRRRKNWSNVALVSSETHLNRVNAIISNLYPGKFKLVPFGVSCNGENSSAWKECEKSSLKKFEEHFGNVKPCDDIEIISRLLDVHEEYKNLPNKENLRSFLMKYL